MSKEKDIVEETMVTEENLNQFMEYVELKEKGFAALLQLGGISLILLIGIFIIIFIIDICVFYDCMGILLSIPVEIIAIPSILLIGARIIDKKNMRKFINKYPDFDTSLDAEDILELIEEFEINSTKKEVLVDSVRNNDKLTENNKLDYISAFEKMSVDEKLAFLEKEKEFWQQEKAKDDLKHDPIQKQIGTIE